MNLLELIYDYWNIMRAEGERKADSFLQHTFIHPLSRKKLSHLEFSWEEKDADADA